MSNSMACRHRKSWLLAGGHIEWCYACGAFRGMNIVREAVITPRTPWQKPVGQFGNNPWEEFETRIRAYQERYGEKK